MQHPGDILVLESAEDEDEPPEVEVLPHGCDGQRRRLWRMCPIHDHERLSAQYLEARRPANLAQSHIERGVGDGDATTAHDFEYADYSIGFRCCAG